MSARRWKLHTLGYVFRAIVTIIADVSFFGVYTYLFFAVPLFLYFILSLLFNFLICLNEIWFIVRNWVKRVFGSVYIFCLCKISIEPWFFDLIWTFDNCMKFVFSILMSVIFGFVCDVTSYSSSEDFLFSQWTQSMNFCSQSWKNYNWPKSDCWSCASCVCCHQEKCLPKHLFLHLKCNLKTMCDFHLSNRITSKHTLIPVNRFPFLPIARNKIQVATTFRPVV